MSDDDDPYSDYDEYDDDDHSQNIPDNKFYFKFDINNIDWSKWLYDALNGIIEDSPNQWTVYGNKFPYGSLPVNSWNPGTGGHKSHQYLGANYQNQPIWKTKYFIHNKLDADYIRHLESNAVHFIKQPIYYKGLFDILN